MCLLLVAQVFRVLVFRMGLWLLILKLKAEVMSGEGCMN
jgi:hypothetical protein